MDYEESAEVGQQYAIDVQAIQGIYETMMQTIGKVAKDIEQVEHKMGDVVGQNQEASMNAQGIKYATTQVTSALGAITYTLQKHVEVAKELL